MPCSAGAHHPVPVLMPSILNLGRAIADLAGSERIEAAHLADEMQYRPRQML